ncbi:MAG: hypothetical protein ABW211_04835 [Acidimicrobiia bacterium]
MSSVMVAGLGDVGVRTARQLLDTPGIDRVYVAARKRSKAEEMVAALHDGATAWELGDGTGPLPSDVRAIAAALPSDVDRALARTAIDAGIAYASATDDPDALGALLALDAAAQTNHTRVVAGCGLAPGLSDVLARHAAAALDTVDEIHVARWGVGGDTCAASARRAAREPGLEWRDHSYVPDRRHGTEIVWFPEPVGARECQLVATGVELLVTAHPGVERVTARMGLPPSRLSLRTRLTPPSHRDAGVNWGSVRAEAWGLRGTTRAAVVYGVIEQTAVATGTVLGVTAAWLAGMLPAVASAGPGAFGLGTVVDPARFLAELARRGVKAAAFEGAAVA